MISEAENWKDVYAWALTFLGDLGRLPRLERLACGLQRW